MASKSGVKPEEPRPGRAGPAPRREGDRTRRLRGLRRQRWARAEEARATWQRRWRVERDRGHHPRDGAVDRGCGATPRRSPPPSRRRDARADGALDQGVDTSEDPPLEQSSRRGESPPASRGGQARRERLVDRGDRRHHQEMAKGSPGSRRSRARVGGEHPASLPTPRSPSWPRRQMASAVDETGHHRGASARRGVAEQATWTGPPQRHRGERDRRLGRAGRGHRQANTSPSTNAAESRLRGRRRSRGHRQIDSCRSPASPPRSADGARGIVQVTARAAPTR
jgi:hypothetical protein